MNHKSLNYLATDLEFTLIPNDPLISADDGTVMGSVSVEFGCGIHWDACQDITLLSPKVTVSTRELRRRSSVSSSGSIIDPPGGIASRDGPYSVSIGKGRYGVVCPRCADKCPIMTQLSLIGSDESHSRPLLDVSRLEDCPKEGNVLVPSMAGRSTVSNVSHLHDDTPPRSESIESFESVSVKSELVYINAPRCDESQLDRSPGSGKSSRSGASTATPVLQVSHAPRVLTMSSTEHIWHYDLPHSTEMSASKLSSERRKERIKQSLSRMSASLASSRADPLDESGMTDLSAETGASRRSEIPTGKDAGRSSLSTLSPKPNASNSQTSANISRGSVMSRHSIQPDNAIRRNSLPASIPESPLESSRGSSTRRSTGHRRDSGCVVYDEDLQGHSNSLPQQPHDESSSSIQEDLLSPVSSIGKLHEDDDCRENQPPALNAMSTLRIHPPRPPIPSAVFAPVNRTNGPATGYISALGKTASSVFSPSGVGRDLMSIFNSKATQPAMWDAFVARAKSPIEFADTSMKMPAVVFTLRGLIRFGDGDYGSTRTDALPIFVHIMTHRHPVCETSAAMEAAECAASIFSVLAVNPVSRRGSFQGLKLRARFESILTAQNGIVLQQLTTILGQQVPKWIITERAKDPALPLVNRAVGSLLEVVLLYANTPKLRSVWTESAPDQFTQSVPILIASLADQLPNLLPKCVVVLDDLLDHIPMHRETGRRTAQLLHSAVGKVQSPVIVAEAQAVINKWSLHSDGSKRRTRSISTFFGLSKSKPSISKSTVYGEYNSLN